MAKKTDPLEQLGKSMIQMADELRRLDSAQRKATPRRRPMGSVATSARRTATQARQKAATVPPVVWWVGGAIVVGGLGYWAYTAWQKQQETRQAASSAGEAAASAATQAPTAPRTPTAVQEAAARAGQSVVPGREKAVPTTAPTYGQRSNAVQLMQLLLLKAGQRLPDGPTGQYGNQTARALAAFEGRQGAVNTLIRATADSLARQVYPVKRGMAVDTNAPFRAQLVDALMLGKDMPALRAEMLDRYQRQIL